MQRKTFFLLIFILLSLSESHAGEYMGFGLHGGMHYDVGNMSSEYGASFQGQQNAVIGALIKFDRDPFFIRSGLDRTIPVSKGEIESGSAGELRELNIQYTSVPFYLGLNFRIRDRGKLYMGFGGAYLIGSGEVKTTVDKKRIDENVYGVGFITGVQLRAGKNIRVYAEWEYISAKTGPVIRTDSTTSYRDFEIDYTGHRIHLGLSYYIF